jgi:DNA-binding transcriptional LysR family regulator
MDSDELRALIAVAATGSYHAAARSLGFSRSTLRRRIGELEARIGRRLVHAQADGVALTAAGVKVAHRGQTVLRELEAMLAHLRVDGAEPMGELRLGAPTGLPPQIFHPIMSLLRTKFPRLSVRLRFFEDPAHAPERELDAYVDFSHVPPLPGWSAYDLTAVDEVLMASPGYLKRRGVPRTIEELHDHELLTWLPPDRDPKCWPRADGTVFEVEPAIIGSNVHVVRLLAEAGAGIVLTPHADLHGSGLSREGMNLVPVLPGLVRGSRKLRLKISDELADIPAFRSLMDITLRIALRGGAPRGPSR